jgi:hypothetical protein
MTRRQLLKTYGYVCAGALITPIALAFERPQQASRSLFVSPNGNDNWPGTKSQPWRTLNASFKRIRSQDELILMGEKFVVPTFLQMEKVADVTIKAYPGQRPTICFSGSSEYSLLLGQSVRRISVEGLDLVRATNAPGNVVGIGGQHITFKNCLVCFDERFSPSKYDGIKILSDSILIEDCEFFGVPNQCIDAVGHKEITIRSNKMHNSSMGVVVKGGCRDILIEKNLFYNLKHVGIGLGGFTNPIWHNHDNTEAEVENATVTRNIVYYDQPNNIGGGIWLKGAKNCSVYNNTLYGAGLHVKTGGEPKALDCFSSDNDIVNNIIFRTGNDGVLVVDRGNSNNLRLRNNVYWKTTGSGDFKIDGVWYNFQEYISHFHFDVDSIFSDPRFVNEKARDFRLRPESPGIKRGIRFNASLQSGVRGSGVDIGAIENQ